MAVNEFPFLCALVLIRNRLELWEDELSLAVYSGAFGDLLLGLPVD